MSNSPIHFSIENLTISYEMPYVKENVVFKNATFDVFKNEVLFILGDNGCGKTSLFRTILGLQHNNRRFIRIPPSDSLVNAQDFLHKLSVGYIPQFPGEAMVPSFTVMDNLLIRKSLKESVQSNSLKAWFDIKSLTKNKDLVDKCISSFPLAKRILEGRYHDTHAMFSGGQIQILNLMAAIVHGADLIILDEPTGKLDSQNRKIFWEILSDVVRDTKATVLCTTHETSFQSTKLIAHNPRILTIKNGVIG